MSRQQHFSGRLGFFVTQLWCHDKAGLAGDVIIGARPVRETKRAACATVHATLGNRAPGAHNSARSVHATDLQ